MRLIMLTTGVMVAIGLCVLWQSGFFAALDAPHGRQGLPSPLTLAADSQELATFPDTPAAGWSELDDPSRDGWHTEGFSENANRILNRLGELILQQAHGMEVTDLEPLVEDGFSCDALIPRPLRTVYDDQALTVRRARPDRESMQRVPVETYQGPHGLARALRELAEPFHNAAELRFKFKLYRLESSDDTIMTRQYLSLSGRTSDGMLQQNSGWVMRWTKDDQGALARLQWIGVKEFEQVASRIATGPLFADCTESVLGHNASYRDQFLLGMNHWLDRIQDTRYFAPLGTPGLALGDVDGNGLDDVYVCQEAGLPNRLFLHRADGTAEDVSQRWQVNWLENSRSALLLDLDNDGDQDLVVAIIGGLVIASNEHQESFQVRDVLPTDDDTMSLCAADYDHDGDLDLYVCVDYPHDFFAQSGDISVLGGASNRVYHDANNAGQNSLYRNDISVDGTWRFTDVTQEVGLSMNNRRFSLAAAWEDFDNDGDQDLYVANDFGRNNLYRNQLTETGEARFVDVARDVGVEDSASGMSVAWGDVDRDGQMDLYVGNMFSAAGGRITFLPQFKSKASPEVKSRLQRFSRGSSLFRNLGDGAFRDASIAAGVNVGRWAWGSNFVDINNDGWEDIVVANGYITTDDSGDL